MTRARVGVVLVLMLVHAVAAAAVDVTIMTGVPGGTYYRVGQDLQRLLADRGFNVRVEASNGAVDNVAAIAQRPGVALGIVQSDVLAFVADQRANPDVARIAASVRLLFPLYDEDVQLLGRRVLTSLENLDGRRVAVGREGSGTYLTARRLLKLADVTPAALVPVDGAEALRQLKAGELDAMFYVVSHPAALFRTGVTADDGLALLEVTHKSVLDSYTAVEIPTGTYAWQPTPVKTVAVKAVLVAFDPERRECASIARLAQAVVQGLPWLRSHGSPSWKRVDLEAPLTGWQQYECVRDAAGAPDRKDDSPAASAGERNPVTDAINGVLGAP
jgi:hypothetical protein